MPLKLTRNESNNNINHILSINNTGTRGELRIGDYTTAGSMITITTTGNIGIGTSKPISTFHVNFSTYNGPLWQNAGSAGDPFPTLDALDPGSHIIGPNVWTYAGQSKGEFRWFWKTADGKKYYDVVVWNSVNFTGQHLCHSDTITQDYSLESKVGLIVVSTGEYKTEFGQGKSGININEALPYIDISSSRKQKSVFGVITNYGNEKRYRHDDYKLVLDYENVEYERGIDNCIRINSVGEGAIWICNEDGNIENGDFIMSSSIPGYGTKQNEAQLCNFTVAKITCDINFNDIDLESKYKIRYIKQDGSILTKTEYDTQLSQGESVYISAFVGCTYHCG